MGKGLLSGDGHAGVILHYWCAGNVETCPPPRAEDIENKARDYVLGPRFL